MATGSESESDPESSASETGAPQETGAASEPCGTKSALNQKAASQVPKGFVTVAGWTAISAATQGKTLVLKGAVPGDPHDIVSERDKAFTAITAAGYTKSGGDDEPGAEADGDFTGPQSGNINVRALCQDHLVVTYTFNQ
jgi:hypothetical protein